MLKYCFHCYKNNILCIFVCYVTIPKHTTRQHVITNDYNISVLFCSMWCYAAFRALLLICRCLSHLKQLCGYITYVKKLLCKNISRFLSNKKTKPNLTKLSFSRLDDDDQQKTQYPVFPLPCQMSFSLVVYFPSIEMNYLILWEYQNPISP